MSKTVIGPGTRITGPLVSSDDLLVEGVVDGPIQGEAQVTVAQGASVGGVVRGRDVVIGNKLAFDVFGSASVRLTATAELTGNIEAPRVAIDEGALFEGQIKMKRAPAAAPAPTAAAPPIAAAPPQAPIAVGPPPEAPSREIPSLPAIGKRKLTRRDA